MIEEYVKSAARQAAKAEMVKGLLWLLGGALVTAVTYSAASAGGTYMVFWGAMAYGAYRFLKGVYFYSNPQALFKKQ